MNAIFNITLPTSWFDLTDKQLHMVYHLFARDLSSAEIKTLCLMKWNGLKVLSQLPDKRFLIKRGKEVIPLSTRQIQQGTSVLDFLDSFASMPVRISRIGKYRALPADFEKVPFEEFLFVENLFQGYLNTQSDELLLQMAQVLYASDHVKPDKAQLISRYRALAIRVIRAASHRPDRSPITLNPAYSPAEALFSRLASPASNQVSPTFRAVIPRAKETARYPSMMGTPLRTPRRNQLLPLFTAVPFLPRPESPKSYLFYRKTGVVSNGEET